MIILLVSEIVLQEIEDRVFNEMKVQPVLYIRYVDDAFIIVNTGIKHLEEMCEGIRHLPHDKIYNRA